MSEGRGLGSLRLGLWVGAVVGAMALLGHGVASEANGYAAGSGPGIIAGIVSKMVDPSAAPERVSGAEITVQREVWEAEGDGEGKLEVVPELSTETDEDGCYVIKEVPSGEYRLTVEAEGLKTERQYVWVDAGRSAVMDFTLVEQYEEGVGTIKGTVLAGEGSEVVGEPIAGAMVEVRRPWPLQGQSFSTLTDSKGRYSLNVPSGFQEVSMWAEGFDSGLKPVKVEADGTVQVNFVPVALTAEPYED